MPLRTRKRPQMTKLTDHDELMLSAVYMAEKERLESSGLPVDEIRARAAEAVSKERTRLARLRTRRYSPNAPHWLRTSGVLDRTLD
jgi:hypothetical protein